MNKPSLRWEIVWHVAGNPAVTGKNSVAADSEERARRYFEFHNPDSVVVSVKPETESAEK